MSETLWYKLVLWNLIIEPLLRWVRKVGYSLKSDVESRTQAQGQGQECSRSRPSTKNTSASVLKKKKRSSKKIFRRSPEKKVFQNFFSGDLQNLNNSKSSAVLEPRTGQFSKTWGFEAKAKDFQLCPQGCPRGQGPPRGLDLWIKWHKIFFKTAKICETPPAQTN